MVPLGTKAPDFSLPDVISGQTLTLKQIADRKKATVVMFLCNHCPYVKHIQKTLIERAGRYLKQGVGFVAISANDVANYPEDSPAKMAQVAADWQFPFPYLYDETQEVARAYRAACTPDFFVFDANLALVYRGQLDQARPGNSYPVTGKDLFSALDCVLMGKQVATAQHPSMGCNIKWKRSA